MGPGSGRLSIVTFEAAGLGDRSYLVHDGHRAVVVDPQRDPAPYLQALAQLDVDLLAVLETHVHNDYLSGGLALARRTRATYGVPGGEPVSFIDECHALAEGDVLVAGDLKVKALSTPGHTPHHLTYWAQSGAGPGAVFTGGSLLAGATGRTDLLGPALAPPLAQAQWRSVRRLLDELDPGTLVLPTHGFGSFCSTGPADAPTTAPLTLATERQRNPAAQLELGPFVDSLLSDPPPVPAYYRHMAPLNRQGPGEPRYGPVPEVMAISLTGLVARGHAVVDVRPRRAFAGGHWPGTLNLELGPSLVTYLGWIVPYESPLVVVAASWQEADQARHLVAPIGREALAGWLPAASLADGGAHWDGSRWAISPAWLTGAAELTRPSSSTSVFLMSGGRATSKGRSTSPCPSWLVTPPRCREGRKYGHIVRAVSERLPPPQCFPPMACTPSWWTTPLSMPSRLAWLS